MLKILKSAKLCVVGAAICFSAIANVHASVPVDNAHECGLQFERCTNTCPTKRCDGNDWKVCDNEFERCLRNAEIFDLKK